jgi:hypothetical protein
VLRLNRVVPAILVATLIAVGLWSLLPTNQSSLGVRTARADPGFCGVRNDTVPAPGTGIMYVVRNKCNFTIRVKIWLTSFQRYSSAGCKSIAPHGFGYFADAAVDRNWAVHSC